MSQTAQPTPAATPIRVVGVKKITPFRDIYHRFLRISWPLALLSIVVVFLFLNAVFALLYLLAGGVQNARPGSFADAFFFSVQTMGTIGYGSMYPATLAGNAIVVCEAVVSLLVTALATGLMFAKFSQSSARIAFSRHATISPWDGVPTLMIRVGNERGNQIIEAQLRVVMIRTERTREGVTFYRMLDLPLTRDRSPAFTRSWSVMHPIAPGSVLYGATPESLKRDEAELLVTVVGIDDVSLQPVHARHTYADGDILWGARHRDVLSELPDGTLLVDVTRFHDVVPSQPTAEFPYPRDAVAAAACEIRDEAMVPAD